MVVPTAFPPSCALPFPERVRIVESHQSGAVGSVERQRIAETMRSFRRGPGSYRDEFDPASRGIDEQSLAVKVQQCLKPRIGVGRCHCLWLSFSDNHAKGKGRTYRPVQAPALPGRRRRRGGPSCSRRGFQADFHRRCQGGRSVAGRRRRMATAVVEAAYSKSRRPARVVFHSTEAIFVRYFRNIS